MYKIRLLAVICLLQCICNIGFSQVNVEWFRTYSAGMGKNFVNDFVMDSSGNSYMTGRVSRSSNNSRYAFGTVKYNSIGELLWEQIYEGDNQSYSKGNALAVDNVGNVYVAGTYADPDSLENNFCIIKYNSAGNLNWVRKYNSTFNDIDEATDIVLDKDNNLYVTGYSYYFFGTPKISSISTLKYDSSGNQLWVTKYEGDLTKNKTSRSIITDNLNVYVSGYTTDDSGSRNFCTIKYNQNGQQQWISFYNNPGLNDEPTDISLDNFGNLYILGQSFITNYGFYTSLIKYDNSGNLIWTAMTDSLGGNDSYYLRNISFKLDSNNNIYIATTYQNYCCTIKYNSNGGQEWISKFIRASEFEFSRGLGINIDNYGNIYTVGFARGFGNIEPFITIKHDPNGILIWERSFNVYNDVEFDEGAFVGFDKDNNVYVAGNHVTNNYIIKYSLLKYSQSVGINNITTEIPSDYNLYQNYPNPFNPQTILQYEIPVAGFVTLRVYDVLGKEIMALVNEVQNAGKYETEFGGSDLPGGVYYYRLTAGGFSQSKKMLLIK